MVALNREFLLSYNALIIIVQATGFEPVIRILESESYPPRLRDSATPILCRLKKYATISGTKGSCLLPV
jgi:hypothetical protein